MKDYQSFLLPYAYNILGSVDDAKDAIQDVVLKYRTKGIDPKNEKNYLIRGVINQSINLKRRQKRTQTDSTWLPEPITTESTDISVELSEMVSYAMLYLLERLNPKERAVFILKQAFAYTHDEIGDVLSISIENSRKILSRAQKKLQGASPNVSSNQPIQAQFDILDKFTEAIRNKDLDLLHQMLTNDIAFHADGGETVQVVKAYCQGIEEVASLLTFVHEKFHTGYNVKPSLINHQPSLLFYDDHTLKVCQIFEFDASLSIHRISVILDPNKLKSLR